MKKIVVIEDEEALRENIFEILDDWGFDVYSADCGKNGIKLINSIMPDLIICDIMMPGLSGYEVKKALSMEEDTSIIPFIFLTAKADSSDVRMGMNLGADDYILKPFKMNDLVESIEARLNKVQIYKNHFAKGTPAEPKQTQRRYITINNSPDLIDTEMITYIESEGNYTHLYFSNKKKLLVRKLIKDWEEILPADKFLRIHQSIIVSISRIEKIERISARNYTLKIRDYTEFLPISQRYSRLIKEKFST
ncbi:MAG: response regulator transcription factor [Melioribacteraceae bacterium]|nr:response regulator transcription factor [Melioribacteraceae bacterium]